MIRLLSRYTQVGGKSRYSNLSMVVATAWVWAASGSAAFAQIHWTSSGGTSFWTNPGNWSSLAVPAAADTVIFDPNFFPASTYIVANPVVVGTVHAFSLQLNNNFLGGTFSFTGPGNILLHNIGGEGLKVRGFGEYVLEGPSIDGMGAGAPVGSVNIGTGAGLTLRRSSAIVSATVPGTGGVQVLNLQGGTLTLDDSAGYITRLLTDTRISLQGGTLSLIGDLSGPTNYNLGAIQSVRGLNTVRVAANAVPSAAVLFSNPGAFTLRPTTYSALSFVAEGGGTLGSVGPSAVKISFVGAPMTGGVTRLLSTGGMNGVGFATAMDANGTTFAAYDSFLGVIGATATLTTLTAAGLATPTEFAQYDAPAALDSMVAPMNIAVLRITPNGPGGILDTAGHTVRTHSIMLDGNHDYTITGPMVPVTSLVPGDPVYYYVNDPKVVLSMDLMIGTPNGPTNIVGPGFVQLTGNNQIQLTNPTPELHRLNLLGGVLRGNQKQIGFTPVDTGTVAFRGGVLEITDGANGDPLSGGTADFTRKLDPASGMGTVNWSGTMPMDRLGGSGGFSAYGSDASVNIDGNLFVPNTLTWGQAGFVQDGYALYFGSIQSNAILTWYNPLALDFAGAADYSARQIRVIRGTGNDKTVMAGMISGSKMSDLVKTGDGILDLATKNSYEGNTIIEEGTLLASSPGGHSLHTTRRIIITGNGTLLYGNDKQVNNSTTEITMVAGSMFNTGGHSDSVGALTLSGSSTLDLASGASLIYFADSSAQPWTGTLSIWNWSGTLTTGGGLDQVYFGGASLTGLTAAQLNQISFYSDSGSTYLGTADWATSFNGEIVPTVVPEPETVVAGLFLLGFAGWRERRRLEAVWKRFLRASRTGGVLSGSAE